MAESENDDSAGMSGRREAVLESALSVFARHGYRRTSMEEVARAGRISRPGLYFLFESKQALFRAAVTRALEHDLAAVEEILADASVPWRDRLVGAFEQWAGRYIGPMARDVPGVIDENPDLLGAVVESAPGRFEELVVAAISAAAPESSPIDVAQTLINVSVGLKHRVETRDAYVERLSVAVRLLVP